MRSDSYLRFSASPLLRFGSAWGAGAARFVGVALLACSAMMAQGQGVYSTHDSTAGSAGPEPIDQFRETWADVKSPGDDFQYAVGTIEVRTTAPGALFSGSPASKLVEPPLFAFPPDVILGAGQRRQIVIVQCTRAQPQAANPATFQDIVWQRYYYGG